MNVRVIIVPLSLRVQSSLHTKKYLKNFIIYYGLTVPYYPPPPLLIKQSKGWGILPKFLKHQRKHDTTLCLFKVYPIQTVHLSTNYVHYGLFILEH